MPDDLDDTRMPLRQHLEELRRCVFRSVVAFFVLFLAAALGGAPLIEAWTWPYRWSRQTILRDDGLDIGPLQSIHPAESVLFHMKVAGCTALLVGAPYFLWQLWTFVGAGLHAHEKRAVLRGFPVGVGLFAAGLLFGFLVLIPLALPPMLLWISPEVSQPSIRIADYFSFTVSLTLLMGLVFELPVLQWVLVRAGLLQYDTLARSRKIALVLMLVFAAIMTPPDVITQVLVALPMVGLYEIGLIFARTAARARERAVL